MTSITNSTWQFINFCEIKAKGLIQVSLQRAVYPLLVQLREQLWEKDMRHKQIKAGSCRSQLSSQCFSNMMNMQLTKARTWESHGDGSISHQIQKGGNDLWNITFVIYTPKPHYLTIWVRSTYIESDSLHSPQSTFTWETDRSVFR